MHVFDCSESRTLLAQLTTLQEQHQHSTAHEQELAQQLVTTKSRLKAADEAAQQQTTHAHQLQHNLDVVQSGLTAANSKLKQLQAAYQEAQERLKRQAEIMGEKQVAHADSSRQVRSWS